MITLSRKRFKLRGLSGLLLVATGFWLAYVFRVASLWPEGTKAVMQVLANFAAIGGVAIFASYYKQVEFSQMKPTLVQMSTLLAALLLFKLLGA